jgi:hypothetical protein
MHYPCERALHGFYEPLHLRTCHATLTHGTWEPRSRLFPNWTGQKKLIETPSRNPNPGISSSKKIASALLDGSMMACTAARVSFIARRLGRLWED